MQCPGDVLECAINDFLSQRLSRAHAFSFLWRDSCYRRLEPEVGFMDPMLLGMVEIRNVYDGARKGNA